MLFAAIGFIVGALMGITGAGGAIMAIPLFQLFLGFSLKEATLLSLVTVIAGTALNLIQRLRDVNWKIVSGLAGTGIISTFLFSSLKQSLSDTVILILLLIIGLFSVSRVWKTQREEQKKQTSPGFFLIILIGLLLGFITSLTGLGGGVLLIPILLSVFGMNYPDALPTSLATIMLVSLSALMVQYQLTMSLLQLQDILSIFLGVVIAVITVMGIMNLFTEDQRLQTRKIVFSFATIISLGIMMMKSL